MKQFSLEEITAYCNQYGVIYQGSEIYGGLANTWDYGPLGSRLKNNIKDAWRYYFIQTRDQSYELDADILMNPAVWSASGHVASFSDPLIDCKHCKMRHRADHLIEDFDSTIAADAMSQDEMMAFIKKHKITCPNCKSSDFTDIRQFNLMFATNRGVTDSSTNTLYLRPENAQGEYVNFLNVQRTSRSRLPFSIGQIGKAFRNEITPGGFTFRTIEFEQMEYQTFCKQGDDETLYDYFKCYGKQFFETLGIPSDHLRFHDHEKLAHYAKAACDIEYAFPWGWGEINGTHNRTDFDLSRHQEYSKRDLTYFDAQTNERYLPYIIESTYGLDRVVLALLFECLTNEELDQNDSRLVLKLPVFLAPIKVNVLPLIKKRHAEKAKEIYQDLRRYCMASYDETGTIGKRYRRGDAIGTPFAITIDDNTLLNGTVTLRYRDSMKQDTLTLTEVKTLIMEQCAFPILKNEYNNL